MIGEALRSIRVIYDYKAKDLAKELEISASYLSEIETGKKTPSLELLEKYSKLLGVRMSTLMFFSEEINESNKITSIRLGMRDKIMKYMHILEQKEPQHEGT